MTPNQNLLYGRPYTTALETDVRKVWARFCPMWAERMKHDTSALPIASVTTHYKPRQT